MNKYDLTAAAETDLFEIAAYTKKHFGVKQRDKYLKKIRQAFDNICQNPKIGRQREEFDEEFLCYLCQNHFIFYRRKKHMLEIIRILNMNMDVKRHLYIPH